MHAGYEWGGAFATPANAYKWVAQAKDGEYSDPAMKLVVFHVHAADKEHLLGMAETAKTLIAGACTVVNAQGTIPAPTEAGACYTLTFPTDPAIDFHATVTTTGVANVAFFTQHAPTEFERDTHYFMSTSGDDIVNFDIFSAKSMNGIPPAYVAAMCTFATSGSAHKSFATDPCASVGSHHRGWRRSRYQPQHRRCERNLYRLQGGSDPTNGQDRAGAEGHAPWWCRRRAQKRAQLW